MTREYRPVMGEITTALFACPDCGAVVWYSLREKHDQLHEQVGALIDTTWQQSELLDGDELEIANVRRQVDDLDSSVRRLDSDVRDLGYRVDDVQRAAERAQSAADSAGRGW